MLALFGKEDKRKRYFLIYTLVFSAMCLIAFSPYYLQGKSFIYDGDGWEQYLKLLIYYANYLRDIFKNILVNQKLIIPEWDFKVGEGAGIIGSFHLYVIGDPISFLSVFVPDQYMYIFYIFGVILRLYLAGIVFSLFCFYFKKNNYYAVLAGTLSYVFCFWCLFNTSRHFHFLNPMILFPLMIIGIEELINNSRPYMFSAMVFITAAVNMYFFCITVIVVVVYVFTRLVALYGLNIREIFRKLIVIVEYSIIGVLCAGFIVLPMMFVLTDDFRLAVSTKIHLIYPIEYYLKLPSMFFSVTRVYWLCMGFPALAFLAISSVFVKQKKNRTLLLLNAICIFFVLSPVFAQVTNGFKYVTNKWEYSLALLAAFDIVYEWDSIQEKVSLIFIMLTLLFVVCMILQSNFNIVVPLCIGLVDCWLFYLATKKKKTALIESSVVFLVIVNMLFNALWYLSPMGVNYSTSGTFFTDDSNIARTSEAYEFSNYAKTLDDQDFYRYSGSDLTINASMLFDQYSTDFYWSLSNKYVSRYRNDICIDEYSLCNYLEYDKRATLYSLANVKYYVTPKGYQGLLPYGFQCIGSTENNLIYINDNYLPFGYTYDKAVSYDYWSSLNGVEKEELMQHAIVIDGLQDYNEVELFSNSVNCSYNPGRETIISDNLIETTDGNATMTISFHKVPGSVMFFSIEGLEYSDGRRWLDNPNTNSNLYLELNSGVTKRIKYATSDDKYQHGRSNFVTNLGHFDEEGDMTIKVVFEKKGQYSFDNISIVSLPMEGYEERLESLKEDHLENVVFSNNEVQGDITLKSSKYLLMSIPYAKGWKAFVDGKETDLLVGNGCYMALKLEPGYHEIVLKYRTPYLNEGIILSVIGFIVVISNYICKKRKRKTKSSS